MWTPVALDGPRLLAVMVKVTFEPTITVPLLAIFVTPISACETMVGESGAEALAVFTSLPPATVAVLVSGLVTAWPTVTAMVITGYEAPAASASERVQVTTWPATPQLQP